MACPHIFDISQRFGMIPLKSIFKKKVLIKKKKQKRILANSWREEPTEGDGWTETFMEVLWRTQKGMN